MTNFSVWTNKSSFLIAGSPDGILTNFPVEIVIPYQGYMRSDFGDIRFTLNDGVTEVPYYLQSYTPSSTATFLVSIPSIPEGTGDNVEVIIYAGNSNVTTTSDPYNVYMDYSDFTGESAESDLAKWTVQGNVTLNSNGVNLAFNGANAVLYSDFDAVGQFIVTARYQHTTAYRNRLFLTTSALAPSGPAASPTGFDYGIFAPSNYWNGFDGVNEPAAWVKLQWINSASDYVWKILSDDEQTVIDSHNVGSHINGLNALAFAATESTNSAFTLNLVKVQQTTTNLPVVGSLGSWVSNAPPVFMGDISNISNVYTYIQSLTAFQSNAHQSGAFQGANSVTEIYGNVSNQSNISCELEGGLIQSLIYGKISNESGLNLEVVTDILIYGAISNISSAEIFSTFLPVILGMSVVNNSILQGKISRESALGTMVDNLATMYPYIIGDLVYFCASILNVSNFTSTLPLSIFYLIENSSEDVIAGLTFEAIYQGENSQVQAVILQTIEGNPDLTVTISAFNNLVPSELSAASENCYEYIQLSNTVSGSWSNNLTVTIPSGGSVTFYIMADIPSSAVAGGWMCALKTTTTVNGAIYIQTISLGGTVLTGNPLIQIAGNNNLPVIAEMGNGNYNNITKFTIDDKINAGVKNFEVDYSTGEYWDIFETGQQLILIQEETTILNGQLQDVDEKGQPGNHTFVMTGRDIYGLALANQNFSAAINCPVAASTSGLGVLGSDNTYPQILNMIIADTPVQLGSTVNALVPNGYSSIVFCGSWSTKKIALDYFFYLLAASGGPELCWYIDNDGFIQVFDATNPGAVSLIIPVSDQILHNVEFVDNSENVVNQITAYGGTNNSIVVTVSDQDSINTYGLIEGPNLQDASLTAEAEVQAAAEAQLALNNTAVYTATITLPQFPGAVSGQPIMFPGHPKYGNTVFIISEVLKTGTQANYTTTITATTDPNVISPMESFDMVQVVADNSVAQNLPVVGVAGAVSADGTQVTVQTVGGVVAANILNPSSSTDDDDTDSGDSDDGNTGADGNTGGLG